MVNLEDMKLISDNEICTQNEKQQRIAIVGAIEAKDTKVLLDHFEYFTISEHNSKSKTVEAYLLDVKGFLAEYAFDNDVDLLDVTRKEASEYKNQLTNYSSATVQRKLTSTRQFFEMLKYHQIIEFNPFEGVKGRKQVKAINKIRHYTKEEASELLEYSSGDLKTVILLGAHAGLRISEMLVLHMTDVDFFGGFLTIRDSKSGQPRRVKLTEQLKEHLEGLKHRDKVITTYKNRGFAFYYLEKLCRELGIQFKGVHGLRHSAGMLLLEASNGNLQSVQSHLGHSSLRMAQHYAQASTKMVSEDVLKMPRL